MRVLLLIGYGIITVLSGVLYMSVYHTVNVRFNLYMLVNALPSFTSGVIGDDVCSNLFECAHYTCKNNLSFTPSYNSTCDMTMNAMSYRYNQTMIQLEINMSYYIILMCISIGMFLSILIPIVTFTIKRIPVIMNAITVVIIVLANVITSMFIVYITIRLSDIRPYTPNYYAILDVDVTNWQISIIVINLVLSVCVLSYLVIQISGIEEHEIKKTMENILFFTQPAGDQLLLGGDFITDESSSESQESYSVVNHSVSYIGYSVV